MRLFVCYSYLVQAHNLDQVKQKPPVMIRIVRDGPGNYIPIAGYPLMKPGMFFMASHATASRLSTHIDGNGKRLFEIVEVNDVMRVLADESPERSPKSYHFTELPADMAVALKRVSKDFEVDSSQSQSLSFEQLMARAQAGGAVLDASYSDMVRMHTGDRGASVEEVKTLINEGMQDTIKANQDVMSKMLQDQAALLAVEFAKMGRDSAPNDSATTVGEQKILDAIDNQDEEAIIKLGLDDGENAPSKMQKLNDKKSRKKKISAKKTSKKTSKKASKGVPKLGANLTR